MAGRRSGAFALLPSPQTSADISAALRTIAAALDGTGPPVLPLPSGPRARVQAFLEAARMDEPLDDAPAGEHIAAAVATSGSTGAPKLALLTAAALRASGGATAQRLGGPAQWLLALPTEHIAGFQVLVRSVLAGTTPKLVEPGTSFTAGVFAAATTELRASRRYTALVPTQLRRLLDGAPAGLDALRSYDAVLVGGAALDAGTYESAQRLGVRVVTTYGMTETCGGCVYDGRALPGVEVRSDEVEPIRLGGPVVFVGYRGRPDLTAGALVHADGTRWHVTADLGRIEPDGRLSVLGRADDVIVTGGEKVTPSSLEAALRRHPEIRDVAVTGRPDPEWGASVVVVIVPRDPAAPPTLADLRAYARESLPSYALPRDLLVVERVPMLASGKPDRAALAALVADERL